MQIPLDVRIGLHLVAVLEPHVFQGCEVGGFEDRTGSLDSRFDEVVAAEQQIILLDARYCLLGDATLLGDDFVCQVFLKQIDDLEALL